LFNDGNVESQNIIKTERNSEGSETNLSERKESVVEQKVFSKANKKRKIEVVIPGKHFVSEDVIEEDI